jgi:hypothetical protein
MVANALPLDEKWSILLTNSIPSLLHSSNLALGSWPCSWFLVLCCVVCCIVLCYVTLCCVVCCAVLCCVVLCFCLCPCLSVTGVGMKNIFYFNENWMHAKLKMR